MTDELRDRIARALYEREHDEMYPWERVVQYGIGKRYFDQADAVLGVLSPTDGWEQVGWRSESGLLWAMTQGSAERGDEPLFRRVDGAAPQPDELDKSDAARAETQVFIKDDRPDLPRSMLVERIDELWRFLSAHGFSQDDIDAWECGDADGDHGTAARFNVGCRCSLCLVAAPPDGEVERRDRDMDRQDIIAQERMIRALNGEVERLRRALSLARSMVLCGDAMSPRAEAEIDAALSGSTIAKRNLDGDGTDSVSGSTTRREERPTECPKCGQDVPRNRDAPWTCDDDFHRPVIDTPTVPEWGSGAL
jgi:hypothetical protein